MNLLDNLAVGHICLNLLLLFISVSENKNYSLMNVIIENWPHTNFGT